jgi:membrane protein YdbS with pleckstrin-like domain
MEWLSPSPSMWRARRAVLGLGSLIVLVAVALPLGFGAGVIAAIVGAAAVLVLAAGVLLLLWRRYNAWGYAEREEDLLVRRGVLVKRLTVVPYGRMQFVDVTAGPVDRIFGLSTVQLHTAAAATDAKIPGLDVGEAERLRDHLAALGEAKASGL